MCLKTNCYPKYLSTEATPPFVPETRKLSSAFHHKRETKNQKLFAKMMALNLQEDFAAVHPEEQQPFNQQHASPEQQRLVGRAGRVENIRPEMPRQRFDDEPIEKGRYQIRRQGIHAADGQEEGPCAAVPHVDQQIERSEEQKAPTAAKQHPA